MIALRFASVSLLATQGVTLGGAVVLLAAAATAAVVTQGSNQLEAGVPVGR